MKEFNCDISLNYGYELHIICNDMVLGKQCVVGLPIYSDLLPLGIFGCLIAVELISIIMIMAQLIMYRDLPSECSLNFSTPFYTQSFFSSLNFA